MHLTTIKKTHEKATQAVLRLVGPVSKTNRNIAADIWFSSLEVVNKLTEKGLTFVGAIKKIQKGNCSRFLPHRK
jgi:hypothetical protein